MKTKHQYRVYDSAQNTRSSQSYQGVLMVLMRMPPRGCVHVFVHVCRKSGCQVTLGRKLSNKGNSSSVTSVGSSEVDDG